MPGNPDSPKSPCTRQPRQTQEQRTTVNSHWWLEMSLRDAPRVQQLQRKRNLWGSLSLSRTDEREEWKNLEEELHKHHPLIIPTQIPSLRSHQCHLSAPKLGGKPALSPAEAGCTYSEIDLGISCCKITASKFFKTNSSFIPNTNCTEVLIQTVILNCAHSSC